MNTGFIGIGRMGGMLVRTFLRSGALEVENVWVANRSQAKLDSLAANFQGIHIAGARQIAAQCDLIFLCLSASDTAGVLAEMDPELSSAQLLLTTAGAIPLKALEARVPCRVARLIPSITQEIGAGIALLMYGSRVSAEDRALLEKLLGRISQPIAIPETIARPAIGLASGGPALLAHVLQSMAEEAVRCNSELTPELARKLVQETAGATMRLMSEANMTTEEIIRRVALPGGMTHLAIDILSQYVPEAWRTMFRVTSERATQAHRAVVL
jgi:competence protein ComER